MHLTLPSAQALAPLVTNGHGLSAGCRHRTILSSGWGWLIEGASYLLCGSGVLTYSPALSCEQSPVAPKKVNTEFPGAWSPEFHSGHAQNSRLGQLPSMLPAGHLIHKQLQRSTQHCFWWLHFLSPSRVLQCKSVSQAPEHWRLEIWLPLPPI